MPRSNVVLLGELRDYGDGSFESGEGDRVGEHPRRKCVVTGDPESELDCTDAEYEGLID